MEESSPPGSTWCPVHCDQPPMRPRPQEGGHLVALGSEMILHFPGALLA